MAQTTAYKRYFGDNQLHFGYQRFDGIFAQIVFNRGRDIILALDDDFPEFSQLADALRSGGRPGGRAIFFLGGIYIGN
jgi:hypothetical protein